MLWALWPRWLTSKGLPLLVRCTQKLEKRGPSVEAVVVEVPDLPWGGQEKFLGAQSVGTGANPRECIWIS